LNLLHRAALYFHALRYLKPVQIWGRLAFRLHRPRPDLRAPPPVRHVVGAWPMPAARRALMLGPSRFRFLNEVGELSGEGDWDSPELPKLWRYNLHYFDDINAVGALEREEWHRAMMARWIAENPPGHGVGWEPYPLSLRIVNWVKWALAGHDLDEAARHSLAVQARYLTRRLERHLLGNHLFANAKALVFAGCYFDGDEAADWLRCGMAILRREIPEQILPDGGHFERSTMYHALAYEDMLDLDNLARTCPAAFASWQAELVGWPELIGRMGRWLAAMCHPDGEIAFFNDAAMGIGPPPAELFAYAKRLGYVVPAVDDEVVWLRESGYVRVQRGDAVLIVDVAPIGPDYLPGHAHADTLSYELSVHGQRVVVNSGTSRYGLGPNRERERGTAAHSTLEIDGEDSSEVWAGFRVARRAYPFDVSVCTDGGVVIIEAAHDGYSRLPGKPVHRRRWVFGTRRLGVFDWVEGQFSAAISRVHLHPAIRLEQVGAGGTASWEGGVVRWQASGADAGVGPSVWHPEFGISEPSHCLLMRLDGRLARAACQLSTDWN
jgi:uncharacterized heparinase superfamily protein